MRATRSLRMEQCSASTSLGCRPMDHVRDTFPVIRSWCFCDHPKRSKARCWRRMSERRPVLEIGSSPLEWRKGDHRRGTFNSPAPRGRSDLDLRSVICEQRVTERCSLAGFTWCTTVNLSCYILESRMQTQFIFEC